MRYLSSKNIRIVSANANKVLDSKKLSARPRGAAEPSCGAPVAGVIGQKVEGLLAKTGRANYYCR
jgi:hypothetical protein